MEDDQLAVARTPDVELDPVRPEVDCPLEGGKRVLGDIGAPGASMCNDAGSAYRATTTESARIRMAIRSPDSRWALRLDDSTSTF
jgi:hypothetical protein